MKSSQNNGQVIIGEEACLRFFLKKKKNRKKNMKNGFNILNFSVNFPSKKMIYTKKVLVNWYLNTP